MPSGCAIAVMPTKVLLFISDIAPFVTATTGAPALSVTVVSLPLRVWTVRLLPSILSSVPRTRAGVSSANAAAVPKTHAATPTAIPQIFTFLDMTILPFFRFLC